MQIGDKVRLLKDSNTIDTRITFSKDEILTIKAIKAYEGEYWYALENSNGDIIRTGSSYFELVEDTMAIKSYLDGVLENLKGDPTMKRIDIRDISIFKDKGIKIEKIGWSKYSLEIINPNIYVKLEFNIKNITQANTTLAPFGYELYQSTDWTRVEVGAKVRISSLVETTIYKPTFKEYIPQTQQIIVFNGKKVEVYNEGEVELC